MEDKKLSMTLRESARKLGLCDEWYHAWKDNTTQQELLNKYIRGIDFALANKWPDNDFIKKNFNEALLLKNGILVDGEHSFVNPKVCVILGSSKAKVRINGITASVIYVRDASDAEIIVHTNEKIIVHAFDKARVEVEYGDAYKPDILVLNHSEGTLVDAPNGVRYKDDFGYLK